MGAKKPMALHTSHHTKEELKIMEKENERAMCSRSFLTGKPPKELIDDVSRKEWRRVCQCLKDKDFVGDLDRYALIGYANAYSLWLKAKDELAAQPSLMIESEKGSVKNPLIDVYDKLGKQVRDFAAKAGISMNSRLTHAAASVKNEPKDEITDFFGL